MFSAGHGQALDSSYNVSDTNDHASVGNGGNTEPVDEIVALIIRFFVSQAERSDDDLI